MNARIVKLFTLSCRGMILVIHANDVVLLCGYWDHCHDVGVYVSMCMGVYVSTIK